MKDFLVHIIWLIYIEPLWLICILMLMCVVLWSGFGIVVVRRSEKAWRMINSVFLVFAAFAVLFTTLFDRNADCFTKPDLIPFHFIAQASHDKEAVRSMLMNVFLFEPLGLTLPFVVKKKPVQTTLIISAGVSLLIEVIQFVFSLGLSETDDLIGNTLGAAVGVIAYVAVKNIYSKIKNR